MAVNQFKIVARFAKQADPTYQEAQVGRERLRDIGLVGLAGLAAGAGARGFTGLINLARRRIAARQFPHGHDAMTPITIPAPAEVETGDDKEAAVKAAALTWDKMDSSMYMPGLMLAGAGGFAGGWKGIDALLDRRRVAEKEQEEAEAKKDFETALLGRFGRQPRTPAEKVGADLNQVFDAFSRKGLMKDAGALSKALGMYLMYAVPTAAGVGWMAYNKGMHNSRAAVLQKALKMRQRQAWVERPAPLFAAPSPQPSEPVEETAEPEPGDDA